VNLLAVLVVVGLAMVSTHKRVSRCRQRDRDLGLDPGAYASGRSGHGCDFNLFGAFIGTKVADTVGKGIIDRHRASSA